MRKIFWLLCAVAMFLLITWAFISKKMELILPLTLCLGLFVGLASLKRPQFADDDLIFLQSPFVWPFAQAEKFSAFWKEIQVGVGGVVFIVAIYGSTFVDWNKWGPVAAQLAIVGMVVSSLSCTNFSKYIDTHKYGQWIFWISLITASVVLGLFVNKWLIIFPLIYPLFRNLGKENKDINDT